MNLAPLKRDILYFLRRRPNSYRELSQRSWTLCPAEVLMSPPAIYLDGDLDKVTALMEDTNQERETSRIRGGIKKHSATIAHLLADVELLDGCLYKSSMKDRLIRAPEGMIGPIAAVHKSEVSLACTLYGNTYFGHWITDDLTLQLAGEGLAEPITVARKPYKHEMEYCRLFAIERRPLRRAKFRQMITLEDVGQNRFKRARYQVLRDRIKASIVPQGNKRVIIRRGGKGANRKLVNDLEIEDYLNAQGFSVIDPDALSASEIVERTAGASLVIGVEGSHMMHGLFTMAEGGVLCVIQPPYRFNNVYKDYTDCLGMRYAFLTGQGVEGGFTVTLDELKRFLDHVEVSVQSL